MMKHKLTIIMSCLLLAVGWTSTAQAQLKPEFMAQKKHKVSSASSVGIPGAKNVMKVSNALFMREDAGVKNFANHNGKLQAPNRAPRRADITASATHVRSWYASKKYDWYDANGNRHPDVSITEPATDPYQIAYLLGTTYMNPEIPGLKYSAVTAADNPYPNIEFGWDIPNNARWSGNSAVSAGTYYPGVTISVPSYNMTLRSITVYGQNNTVLTSWDAVTAWNNGEYNSFTSDGNTYYYFTLPGWYCSDYLIDFYENSVDYGYMMGQNHIFIPSTYLNGNSSIRVVIRAYSDEDGEMLTVNGEDKPVTNSLDTYTWTITGTNTAATASVTPPTENGYTVFLVKVKDGTGAAPAYTYTWNSGSTSLIDYFDNYIDEVQLLTDGTRLNETTDDAGTMFSYSGELNRFYFLGKGNDYWWGSSQSDWAPHLAPTYDMYEEFSPTTTANGAQTEDFYSKLLYGNSYNVIHDCRGMNYLQHYFSMSGNAGTDHKSMTNLVFWIPDSRGKYNQREYDEDHLPHVGLYTITLEAEAKPADSYSTSNRKYEVTCDWVSSLNTILDFDVDQDYELWIYTYDNNGNPVAEEKVTDLIVDENGLIHNSTTHSYLVDQNPESYTIVYRVKGWPKDATNSPGKDPENGTFYALSNLAPVLIPGYNDFLSLDVAHYESDFDLNSEHNYYRNFLSVDNQNSDNALTASRIENNENHYQLWRYDVAKPNETMTKAADLQFTVANSKVEYDITYDNQFYVDEANIYNEKTKSALSGYTDPNALGCPTHGEIAKISEGGGEVPPVTYDDITITPSGTAVNFTRIAVVSGNTTITEWAYPTSSLNSDWNCTSAFNVSSWYGCGFTSGTITIPASLFSSYSNIKLQITAYGDNSSTSITVNGVQTGITTSSATYNWDILPTGGATGFTMLNNYLDNSTYTQVGQVVFDLPWKSIQVKLQEESAGSASGYFFIQNNGRLRFIMPAGYNNANLRFVIHNATAGDDGSNYYHGTFTLSSSTGDSRTIDIPEGSAAYADRDYEAIFTGISTGDVITITGTHVHDGILYNYSPDFKYIHVYVEGGHDGISENTPLNLAAINFVDQFKAETDKDQHPKRYGYVLKLVGGTDESGKPEVPVQHTGSSLYGYYSLNQIQNDTKAPLLQMNVMNADVNMTLSRDPEIYYFTLDRKSNTDDTWEELSELQRREDDSYQELDSKLDQYNQQICNPPAESTTPWIVDRYDNDVMTGEYNSSMSYVPIIWTHGDQNNRRVKWNTEERHNSYGAPIWMTGVAQVNLTQAVAERQEDASTKWTYGGENCSLYMLDKIEAVAKLPTVNNVTYVPYMFRIFVRSNNHKLRGYRRVADGEDPNMPSSHFVGDAIDDDALQCVWSGYVNDLNNDAYGVTISNPDPNTYVFHKNKVDRTNPNGGAWDKDKVYNAIFAGLENIVTGTKPNYTINPEDLTIVVRFYYLVEGFNTAAPGQQRNGDGNDDPAGYGAEGSGDPGGWTGVSNLLFNKTIESVTYVNPQGMQSDKPFSGVNIVITRYSDGSATTAKVVR